MALADEMGRSWTQLGAVGNGTDSLIIPNGWEISAAGGWNAPQRRGANSRGEPMVSGLDRPTRSARLRLSPRLDGRVPPNGKAATRPDPDAVSGRRQRTAQRTKRTRRGGTLTITAPSRPRPPVRGAGDADSFNILGCAADEVCNSHGGSHASTPDCTEPGRSSPKLLVRHVATFRKRRSWRPAGVWPRTMSSQFPTRARRPTQLPDPDTARSRHCPTQTLNAKETIR